jgi:hypothetical protein
MHDVGNVGLDNLSAKNIFILHIQGVPGGMSNTSGGCSLC